MVLDIFEDPVNEPEMREEDDDGGDTIGEEAIETRFDALLIMLDDPDIDDPLVIDALLELLDCAKTMLTTPRATRIFDDISFMDS
jgi:hypothetical protein